MQNSAVKTCLIAVFYTALSLAYAVLMMLNWGDVFIKWYMGHALLFSSTLAGVSVDQALWAWSQTLNTVSVVLFFLAAGAFASAVTGILILLPGYMTRHFRWIRSLHRCHTATESLH